MKIIDLIRIFEIDIAVKRFIVRNDTFLPLRFIFMKRMVSILSEIKAERFQDQSRSCDDNARLTAPW